ncbi:long-chain fatty acid--CoA ligase [Solihabitans fulvus]|uniref:Long-chain fatty acid--CoA ligase n=1 Tax=Solihabitans fulvus TaxID=1892852 RepID=A0A5B2WX41_9PSEU|nr:long-chain fatty acid--CoA ligase [Solihabitans fulvus]KAA2255232.1 long-chain fatty acid--CoA ligase [Solihabitans fulvus]
MLSTMQDQPLTITQILRHGSTVHGEAQVATWTGTEARRRSYAEVGRRAARLAWALRGLGVTGDERVGTLMWNNAEHLEAYLAVPSMGAVLHTLNLRLAPNQLAYVINHAEDQVILVDGSVLPLLTAIEPLLTTVRHIVVVGTGDASALAGSGRTVHDYEELLAAQPDEFDWPELDERSAAAMCYTSGTTGDPKGVAYSHRSTYLHSMQINTAESFGLSWSDIVLPVVPMFHANAWGLAYAAFMCGASMLMPDRYLQPAPLAAMIAAEQPTVAGAVPTIWSGLLDELDARPVDVSSLDRVVVGGSACPPALMRAFQERHQVTILHAWGMTETSPLGAVAHPPARVSEEDAWAYRYTQGRFPCGVRARLIGPDGSVMPHDGDSVGELEVRGPWVAAAYYLDQDAEKFDDGWLRTGDVATISADGYLTLTDRAKDVIKSGGEWISSVDLENNLMAHPSVAEAAVIAVPDPQWSERPLATVVLREGATAGVEELRDFLAERVPRWQVPERWAIIAEVPKTSVGKFDKKRLRARYADGELDVLTIGRG